MDSSTVVENLRKVQDTLPLRLKQRVVDGSLRAVDIHEGKTGKVIAIRIYFSADARGRGDAAPADASPDA